MRLEHVFRITSPIPLLVVFLVIHGSPPNALGAPSAWKTDEDGWVLRKAPGAGNFERFFAIGLWNVPGYTFTRTEEPDSEKSNAELFWKRTEGYNMTFVQAGYEKEYMKRIIHFIGSADFPHALNKYLDSIPAINGDPTNSPYLRAQYLRKNLHSSALREALDATITRLKRLNATTDCAWAPIDEIVGGGAGDWNWPEGAGDLIYERIRHHEESPLVFTDLVGVGRGNSYLFELRYLQTHKELPPTPPFDEISSEARQCVKKPLLGFRQAYNGLPVYEFPHGEYRYKPYPFETLREIWFENLRLCAAGFQHSGNVFGINAFMDFYAHPVLSGLTVDALKAGAGPRTPIWLYFDGNGYAKPAQISAAAYVANVKCQIYTSLIHGATGVLFWNDRSKPTEVFDTLAPVIRELNGQAAIFRSKTIAQTAQGDLHYQLKAMAGGRRYLLASNTSTREAGSLDVPGAGKVELKPLEVIVKPL